MKTSRPSRREAMNSPPVCGLSADTLPMVCGCLANASGVSSRAANCAMILPFIPSLRFGFPRCSCSFTRPCSARLRGFRRADRQTFLAIGVELEPRIVIEDHDGAALGRVRFPLEARNAGIAGAREGRPHGAHPVGERLLVY